MGRAPCCEKMGLKKGPWTPEEDQILITYIHLYGHSNWRALPKQAGLLRCGKSCRLRWTNYLRPDIKRGNFTKEEEDTIISLHQMLGNRWSAIAARLPGRTDNEIKNVWHTHLKKRLAQQHNNDINIQTLESDPSTDKKRQKPPQFTNPDRPKKRQQPVILPVPDPASDSNADPPLSPCSASDVSSSSVTTSSHLTGARLNLENNALSEEIIDDSFWSEVLSAENSVPTVEFDEAGPEANNVQYSIAASPLASVEMVNDTNTDGDMDFWYNLFTLAGDMLELPEF